MIALAALPASATEAIIRNIPLFSRIRSRADLIALATLAKRTAFAAGEVVHAPGPVTEIAVILAGTVAVRLEGDVEPLQLNVGSMMGEMEFFHPSPNAALLVALDAVELLCFSFAGLRELVEDNPNTGVHLYAGFMHNVVDKMRRINDALLTVSRRNDAQHLAHDLRAPIAALRTLGASMSALPQRERDTFDLVVSRMDGIAASTRGANAAQPALSDSLTHLLQEKRVQHAASSAIAFARTEGGHFGAFRGPVDTTALLRIVSNLLDNSAEVLGDGPGQVTVSLLESPSILRIDVTDSGPGIPQHVLEQLGSRPVTHGKRQGQGIGVFHACRVVEGMGGQLVICSSARAGTVISLRLYAVA